MRTWKSPATGGVYPVHVKLATTDPATGQPVTFTLEPILLQQELSGALGGIPYWEGACRVLNEQARERRIRLLGTDRLRRESRGSFQMKAVRRP